MKTVAIHLDDPIRDVDLEGHTHLYVTAFWRGRPLGFVVLPAPLDPFPAGFLADALVARFANSLHAASLEARLEQPMQAQRLPSASVIVCTRDRPGRSSPDSSVNGVV
jgi:hypothetical protein